MRIYVDFDDVVCETARYLAQFVNERFGSAIAYEDIRWFDLRRSLRLSDTQYHELMRHAHHDGILTLYPPTPGAIEVMLQWRQAGHDVTIVTGRPAITRPASRQWLATCGLPDIPLICVDKYRREKPPPPGVEPALTPEEFATLRFDAAIEDAPAALDILAAGNCRRIFIFDRPWNRDYQPPDNRFSRAANWMQIAASLENHR